MLIHSLARAASKYPEASFVSKEIKNIKGTKFTVVGDLTLHGVTKPVELDAEWGFHACRQGTPHHCVGTALCSVLVS